ncbi:hypothetical protein DB35_11160 [Streptomyces abyssalis]|uniref:Uncharacterized protein n=1 Tax=Streptomyces abyssalis TaxID=933944 RepID=A0A1E7JHM4_9ACTN|nr:hypothetical protein AN215_26745 [Streptomyces abyssalis]OEU92571.1 hypothetical protein DB35_11160 [Streptomyces abyssalis]
MPLPFMTSAGQSGAAEQPDQSPSPLPHDVREHWRRPYRPGPWRVGGAAVLLLLASYMLFSALIIAMSGAIPGALVCLGAAAAVIGLALRLLRVGVWVSAYGLRRVGLLNTVTLGWADVAAVRTVQQPVRWLGLPRTVQGQALDVVRAGDGERLRTLLTDHNADFLARPEAFDRAADVIEGWAAESRSVAEGTAHRW